MLKYEIKLGRDNFKQIELEWSEKYLAPDLSYVSGVTSTAYHLEKFRRLPSKGYLVNSNSILSVEPFNVTRQGFVVASGKTYDVISGETYDYSIEKSGEKLTYHYVKIRDKYFYWGRIREGESGYTIDNLLNYDEDRVDEDGNPMPISEYIEVQASEDDEKIKIDTLYWIENGVVNIDGYDYFYDKDDGYEEKDGEFISNGSLKYEENGDVLPYSAITECDSIDYFPYSSSTQYKDVTKVIFTKQDEISESFSNISFCKYYYYIKYKNHYCQIKKSMTGDTSYEFLCEIPKYVVSGGIPEYNLEPIDYKVYYSFDVGNEDPINSYRQAVEDEQYIDNEHYDEHGVKLLDELKNAIAFVYVEDDDVCITVERDVVNANSGNEIIIYLDNIYSPLKAGEKIEFIDTKDDKYESLVYDSINYGSNENETFVFYNGRKYIVQKNICDKVVINDNEYDIDYINGKESDVDCIVIINDERVPMKIDSVDGGEYESGELVRYGKIISGEPTTVSIKAKYSIKPYDGIYVNGMRYIIYDISSDDIEMKYASIGLPNKYTFVITDIIGNSTYICEPYINSTDFTEDFGRYMCEQICADVVLNQRTFDLKIKNKVFGECEITEDLAFKASQNPKSSSDYYDLFNDLKIYVDNGYINIPILLKTSIGNDCMQDDIIEKDFFRVEKEKAINPIVDMEKDVYLPKYIFGHYDEDGNVVEGNSYMGSKTIFNSIYEINLNFHFRTRNLESWKVNDGYNSLISSADTRSISDNGFNNGLDNWFVTDFYPYRYILEHDKDVSGDTLQNASDLIGLLYFTDNDVFYQKSKVEKSFARLSFYDSTDPQTQSLLATSCVFLDEHALYKKFIDNSRKYFYEYGQVEEPKYEENDSGFTIHNALTDNTKIDVTTFTKYNKIHVNTEFLGRRKFNKKYSKIEDSENVIIDESHRISSRLTINNKYETDTSSEGFYMYIFREYSENLHPKPIYMKIEFNHASIGKTIPFVIPMHWGGNTTNSNDLNYNKMYPERPLKLSSNDDLKELKEGFPLSYTYAQTYIPLYAVYDFEHKEYGYVFDNRYVTQDRNGVINLNLFEMKIKNEKETPTQAELINIKLNRQKKAIININEEQFNKDSFNTEQE